MFLIWGFLTVPLNMIQDKQLAANVSLATANVTTEEPKLKSEIKLCELKRVSVLHEATSTRVLRNKQRNDQQLDVS